jgi:hypothetical protein
MSLQSVFVAFHESPAKMIIADCICAIIAAIENVIVPQVGQMIDALTAQLGSEFELSVLRISEALIKLNVSEGGPFVPFSLALLQLPERLATDIDLGICDSVICTLTDRLKAELAGELRDRVAGFALVPFADANKVVFVSMRVWRFQWQRLKIRAFVIESGSKSHSISVLIRPEFTHKNNRSSNV